MKVDQQDRFHIILVRFFGLDFYSLSNTLTLVASQNGLGHARRLALLAISAAQEGMHSTLVVTTRQIQLLQAEFSGTRLRFFELNEQFELDGPGVGTHGFGRIVAPSPDLIALVSASNICISDNLVWPAKFATKFVLLANFLWSDYWRLRNSQSQAVARQDELEQACAPFVSARFAIQTLSFSENARLPVSRPYKFLRYPRDHRFSDLVLGPDVWLSGGTTGLFNSNQFLVQESDKLQERELMYRETWELGTSHLLPWAVFGRPGLGTLRDCMAAGIPLFPLGYDLADPEMSKNAEFAQDFFELEDPASLPELDNGELQKLRSDLTAKRGHFLEKWSAISEDTDSLLSRILERFP
jgi:hypothetical protein